MPLSGAGEFRQSAQAGLGSKGATTGRVCVSRGVRSGAGRVSGETGPDGAKGLLGRDCLEPSLGNFSPKGVPWRPWSGEGVCGFVPKPHTLFREQVLRDPLQRAELAGPSLGAGGGSDEKVRGPLGGLSRVPGWGQSQPSVTQKAWPSFWPLLPHHCPQGWRDPEVSSG